MTSRTLTGKLSLFASLSLADLVFTRFLLARPGCSAYEWNPVAAWWLMQFDWVGLVGFKFANVVVVLSLTVVVSRRRPRLADQILNFGCGALLAVIVHSSLLVAPTSAESDHAQRIDAQIQRLDRQLARANVYGTLINNLSRELASRHCTLAEAVELLAATERAHDPQWQRKLRLRFPSYSMKEALAIRLIEDAIVSAKAGVYGSAPLYRELKAQFRSCFGRPAPRPAIPWDEKEEAPRHGRRESFISSL